VLRCSLAGDPVEVMGKAYRPGKIELSIGGKPVSAAVLARSSASNEDD